VVEKGEMKLVLISDTHCQHEGLDIPLCDVLVHAGDWTGRGSERQTVEFLKWFEAQTQATNRVFIAGNHDFYPERFPSEFRALVKQHAPSCTYLQDESAVIMGRKFYGSPISPWFCDWAFNRYRGSDIQRHWDLIPDDVDVLVTHGPVLGYGDKLSEHGSQPGANVGCVNLLNTIEWRLHNLKLHVSGHIHEGAGTYKHGDITLVNASVLDEHYRMRNAPVVVELPDPVVPDSNLLEEHTDGAVAQKREEEAEATQEDEAQTSRGNSQADPPSQD
jgi:predicted phosphodiesterase